MIYTWAADVAPLLDPIIYEAYYREVPQWRQEKADRIRFSEDRALSIGAIYSGTGIRGRANGSVLPLLGSQRKFYESDKIWDEASSGFL